MNPLKLAALLTLLVLPLATGCAPRPHHTSLTIDRQNTTRIIHTEPTVIVPRPIYVPAALRAPPVPRVAAPRPPASPPVASPAAPEPEPAEVPQRHERTTLTIERTIETRVIKREIIP